MLVYNIVYAFAFLLFFTSIVGVVLSDNMLKKVVFLNSMQVSVIIFFVSVSYKRGAFFSPVYQNLEAQYVNPVSHVLMLTAIVVGFATTSLAIAICFKLKSRTGSILESIVNEVINNKKNEF